jgi:cell division protein ZapA (FtsZ GTPase activity inhibitor)
VAEKTPVRVTIFNAPYTLLAQGDPQELIDAAQTVDDLMHGISERASTADSTRIAVLACLQLADKLNHLERTFKARTNEIVSLLDQIE